MVAVVVGDGEAKRGEKEEDGENMLIFVGLRYTTLLTFMTTGYRSKK